MAQRFFLSIVFVSALLAAILVVGVAFLFREPLSEWLVKDSTSVVTQQHSAATGGVVSSRTSTTSVPSVEKTATVADMVAHANPAVVSIVATKDVPVYERVYEEYEPFGGIFGGRIAVPRLRERGTEEQEVGGGSGFVVNDAGLIVTNQHVVSDTKASYAALFADGAKYPVSVLARDDILDIAIVRVSEQPEKPLPHLEFGNSDELRLGQEVVAIGNALAEFDNTVSSGVISGLSRSITARGRGGAAEELERVIQTDAAINPGNSGGPLLDMRGRVVGVNVAASLNAQNIGFALPINVVAQIVRSVEQNGEIVRPFLGVRYRMLDERIVEANNLKVEYGALVLRGDTPAQLAVVPGSPAAKAGLQEGDIIRSVSGTSLQERGLASLLREQRVGETIQITVWRNGETKEFEVTLTEAP
jgi:serine protease Do